MDMNRREQERKPNDRKFGRRSFLKLLGLAGGAFAANTGEAFAQIGGNFGPEAAPPPAPENIPDSGTILSRSQLITPEAISARRANLLTPNLVKTYDGRGSKEFELEAGEFFNDVLATYSGYQGMGEVARALNEYASAPRNPGQVTPDNVKVVKDFGVKGEYGSLMIGTMAPDWDNCNDCWSKVDPNIPISTVRGIQNINNRFGREVPALELGILIGRKKQLNPDDIAELAQSLLFPYYLIKHSSDYYGQKLDENGGLSVESAIKMVVTDVEFGQTIEQRAWTASLERVDVLMGAYSNWHISSEFSNFYQNYPRLK